MSKQDQRVGEGATAIQAQGSVTVNHGMSPQQMGEIMVALAGQLQQFIAEADKKAQERFDEFREEVLRKFSDPEEADSAAFRDPDFQFLLRGAQEAYARSGQSDVGEALVNLLGERSKRPGQTRTALIINKATETVHLMTKEELSALSVAFVLFRTSGGAFTFEQYTDRLNAYITPFLDNLPTTTTAYDYLASLGCMTINTIVKHSLGKVLSHGFPGIFTNGFTFEQLAEAAGGEDIGKLLLPLLTDPAGGDMLRFKVATPQQLSLALKSSPLPPDRMDAITALYEVGRWSDEHVVSRLTDAQPETMARLQQAWATSLASANLTAVGITLAHANLRRVVPQFRSKLEIWLEA